MGWMTPLCKLSLPCELLPERRISSVSQLLPLEAGFYWKTFCQVYSLLPGITPGEIIMTSWIPSSPDYRPNSELRWLRSSPCRYLVLSWPDLSAMLPHSECFLSNLYPIVWKFVICFLGSRGFSCRVFTFFSLLTKWDSASIKHYDRQVFVNTLPPSLMIWITHTQRFIQVFSFPCWVCCQNGSIHSVSLTKSSVLSMNGFLPPYHRGNWRLALLLISLNHWHFSTYSLYTVQIFCPLVFMPSGRKYNSAFSLWWQLLLFSKFYLRVHTAILTHIDLTHPGLFVRSSIWRERPLTLTSSSWA